MPLQLPMLEPMMCNPSLMYTRIRLLISKTCMTIAAAKLPDLVIVSLIPPHPSTLTAIAFQYCMIMIGHSQQVLPLQYHTYAPACHQIPLVSPKCSNDGEKSGALNSPEPFSQEPHSGHS
jgi:hypothetical protein